MSQIVKIGCYRDLSVSELFTVNPRYLRFLLDTGKILVTDKNLKDAIRAIKIMKMVNTIEYDDLLRIEFGSKKSFLVSNESGIEDAIENMIDDVDTFVNGTSIKPVIRDEYVTDCIDFTAKKDIWMSDIGRAAVYCEKNDKFQETLIKFLKNLGILSIIGVTRTEVFFSNGKKSFLADTVRIHPFLALFFCLWHSDVLVVKGGINTLGRITVRAFRQAAVLSLLPKHCNLILVETSKAVAMLADSNPPEMIIRNLGTKEEPVLIYDTHSPAFNLIKH